MVNSPALKLGVTRKKQCLDLPDCIIKFNETEGISCLETCCSEIQFNIQGQPD